MALRYAARVDETQAEIVKTLRHAGAEVYLCKLPCDLVCYFRGQHFLIDCEGITKNRKRSKKQLEIFRRLGVRLAPSATAALHIIGAIA